MKKNGVKSAKLQVGNTFHNKNNFYFKTQSIEFEYF